jgi:anaerobic ribonucleoside-triphosphate reductase activating protein
MAEAELNLARLAYPVTALGPGRRAVLWVAGCPLQCPGCISPELRDPAAGARLPWSRVLARLLALPGLDGITLTGGEPFAQAGPLAELLEALAPARPDWDVLAYSGYSLARLRRLGPDVERLLAGCDVLVAGPYRADRPARHPLAGSGNQRVYRLSPRSQGPRWEDLPDQPANLGSGAAGDLLIGILNPARRARLHRDLGLRAGRLGDG